MSEQQEPKKKTGARPIGGISQYATLGSGKHSDSQATTNQDSQISSNLDSQVVEYPESQATQFLDNQNTGKQDKQMVSYLKEKKPERKAQIAYLPPALIKRLKRYAVDNEQEISEVVADAVDKFLNEQEGRHE